MEPSKGAAADLFITAERELHCRCAFFVGITL